MNNLLLDKNILIAGAGGLIGSKIVAKALAQGANVIAADIDVLSMKNRLLSVNIDIDDKQLTLVELDITNEQSLKNFFSQQTNMDGAVNTTYPRNKKYGAHFFDVSLDSFNENVSLHLGSAFLFMQQCALYFKRNKSPFSLVNFSSIYGIVAPRFDVYENTHMTMPVEYAAIKSGIVQLNKYVAAYVNDSDFRVNSVSPGGIFDYQDNSFLAKYKKNTHGKGMLDPDDVIGAVLFLLSEQSKYITGQNIVVDDGFSL